VVSAPITTAAKATAETMPGIVVSASRVAAGDDAGCPGHPAGPHNQLNVAEVLEVLPATPGWNELNVADPPSKRLRGAQRVLDWLRTYPGSGWQQRWLAGDADHDSHWVTRLSAGDPRDGQTNRRELRAGMNWLLLARVLHPGYGFFHHNRALLLMATVPRVISPVLFDRLGCSGTASSVSEPLPGVELTPRQLALVRVILSKIVLHTGKDLERLHADDLLEFRDATPHYPGFASAGLPAAWDLLVRAGVLSAGSSLRAAIRPGQRSVAELVDTYNIRSHNIRTVFVRYFEDRRVSVDYSTLRNKISVIAQTFWGDIEHHHPGIDSLRLPEDVALGWKERLRYVDVGNGRTRPRESYFSILMWVNSFYADIAEWARTDPFWVPHAVPSPVRRTDTAGISKHRQKTTARMHQRTRERLPQLPVLAQTADRHRREQAALLAAANTVAGGETFTLADMRYRRVIGAKDFRGARYRNSLVRVDNLHTGQRLNLTYAEDDAFWAWAIIETLRHTGIRVEELLELTHLALISHRLPKTGEVVPLLQIVPSKSDQERLLLVAPELASVLATIITRLRQQNGGSIRLVSRFDYHERITGPPLPHLFQTGVKGNEHAVLGYGAVCRLLNDTVERAGLRDVTGEPLHYKAHDFRRIFATDAVAGGLPLHIAARLLGHQTLNTFQTYHAVFHDELIRAYRGFLDNRRALRPQAEYREPTDAEWREFEQHFEQRKLELGSCGRPYGAPCQHEHACIRCSMLRVDPRQRRRLAEITHNLSERIKEARANGWLGEVEGLHISLNAAKRKLASLEPVNGQPRHADLGMPGLNNARATQNLPVRTPQ
jgi:integrase